MVHNFHYMRRPVLFIILSIIISSVFLFSCKKKEETKLTMGGGIKYDMPEYVMVGTEHKLTVSGITLPENPKYFWKADTLIAKDTVWGQEFAFKVPSKAGNYSITAGAMFTGYYTRTLSMTIFAIDPAFNASVKGIERKDSIQDVRDGNWYYVSKIGQLWWFTQNLRYKPVGVPYINQEPLGSLFGHLYSWKDATGGFSASGVGAGPQGVCPAGWSVPTKEDWENLGKELNGGVAIPYDNLWVGLGGKVTTEAYFHDRRMWAYSPDNLKENKFGWNALPTGSSKDYYKRFNNLYQYGMWWSSTQKSASEASYRYIYYNQSYFAPNVTDKETVGVSVRCVKKVI